MGFIRVLLYLCMVDILRPQREFYIGPRVMIELHLVPGRLPDKLGRVLGDSDSSHIEAGPEAPDYSYFFSLLRPLHKCDLSALTRGICTGALVVADLIHSLLAAGLWGYDKPHCSPTHRNEGPYVRMQDNTIWQLVGVKAFSGGALIRV